MKEYLLSIINDKKIRIGALALFIILFGITAFSNKFFNESIVDQLLQTLVFFSLIIGILLLIYKIKTDEVKNLINKLDKIQIKGHSSIILVYLIISLLTFSRIILSQGTVGLRDDWVIPPYNEQVVEWGFEEKDAWMATGLGTANIYPSEYILRFTLGAISYLFNLNGEVISKLFLIIIMTLAGSGGYFLGNKLKLKKQSAFVIGLFYMLTPVLFNKIIPGYLTYILSYALLPIILGVFIDHNTKKFKLSRMITLGLLIGLGATHIQFFALIPITLTAYSLFNIKSFRKKFFYITGSMIIATLIHMNWILPLVIDQSTVNNILASKSNTWVESFNPPVTNTLLLFGATYGFFSEVLQIDISLFLLWALSALALLFLVILPVTIKTKNKNILGLSILTIIFLFVSKGSNPPLGFIFRLLYKNISLLTIFRDLHGLLVIPCLGYSILLGYSLKTIKELTKNNSIILILFALIITIYAWPFFTGNFGGYLQTYQLDDEYRTLYDNLKDEEGDYRIVWLPIMQPVSYPSSRYPGLDPLVTYSPKDTLYPLISSDAPQEVYSMNLDVLYHEDITDNTKVILSLGKIKYLIYRYDVESKMPNFHYIPRYPEIHDEYTNEKTLSILQNQRGIKKLDDSQTNNSTITPEDQFTRYEIYEINNTNYDRISITNNNYLITGGYKELIELDNKGIINNFETAFFSSQLNNAEKLTGYVKETIIKNDHIELITSFIPEQHKMDIGEYTYKGDAEHGWTAISKWGWYEWDYISQLETGAFTLTSDELEIKVNINKTQEYAFLIKPFYGPKTSNISLSVNNLIISDVNTKSIYKEDFKWVYLTNYKLDKGENTISLISDQGENAVLRMIVIPLNELENAINKQKAFLEKNQHTIIHTINNNLPEPRKTLIESISEANGSYFAIKNDTKTEIIKVEELNEELFENYTIHQLDNYYPSREGYFNISKKISFKINSPINSNYTLLMNTDNEGNVSITINNEEYNINYEKGLSIIGNASLSEGENVVTINSNQSLTIKSLLFKQESNEVSSSNSITYEKESNTKYNININTNSNAVLVFSESYHDNWILQEEETINSIPCNGFSNCYLINEIGNNNVTLTFKRQEYYDLGSKISIISFIIMIIIVILNGRI